MLVDAGGKHSTAGLPASWSAFAHAVWRVTPYGAQSGVLAFASHAWKLV